MKIVEKLEWILITDRQIYRPRYTESINKNKKHSNIIDIAKYIKRKC